MIIFDFLESLKKVIDVIEDATWDELMNKMFPSSDLQFTSAINVNIQDKPNTAEEGSRSITANIRSDDPLERILGYAIETFSLAIRLQRSGQDKVPIERKKLISYVSFLNSRISNLENWYDDCMSDINTTSDYKKAVKETYKKCSDSIQIFNRYVLSVNAGKSDILWAQPDSGARIPSITPLPAR